VYPDVDQFFTDLSRAYAVADLSKAGLPLDDLAGLSLILKGPNV
jgi:hypothetical protein